MRVEVQGIPYSVERFGAGPPLLLLHGFTGSAGEWSGQFDAWAAEFEVVALDLPGHGGAGAPSHAWIWSMERAVADLDALSGKLGLERAHVLGYSMGGRLALGFALAFPQRVQALVLESASPGLADPAERAARLQADLELASRIERQGVPAFVEHWESLPLWSSQTQLASELRSALHARRLRNDARGLAWALRGLSIGAQPVFQSQLASLDLPVLCIAGELDRKFAAIALDMAGALPRGEAWIVPGAGHAAHLERPVLFAEAAAAFLRRHPG